MTRDIVKELAHYKQFAEDAEFERDTWKGRAHAVMEQRDEARDDLSRTHDALVVVKRREELVGDALRSTAFTPEESRKFMDVFNKALISNGLDTAPELWVCAFCKLPGTVEVIQEHHKVCEKHPLAHALKEVERLRAMLNKALTYVDESVKDEWAREEHEKARLAALSDPVRP